MKDRMLASSTVAGLGVAIGCADGSPGHSSALARQIVGARPIWPCSIGCTTDGPHQQGRAAIALAGMRAQTRCRISSVDRVCGGGIWAEGTDGGVGYMVRTHDKRSC